MCRRTVRRVIAAVAMLAATLTAAEVPSASPAIGATPAGLSACTSAVGVLVAVDFKHFGGPVDLGCAAGRQANGLDAVDRAGFLTVGDEEDGDAFVCRIGVAAEGVTSERPTAAEDSCVNTPPATAYWAFWVADAGQNSWSYSPFGVESYEPPPGSIEGWAFGSGGQPGVTPAQLRAEATPTTTTSSTSTSTSTSSTTTSTTAPVTTTTRPSTAPTTTVKNHRQPTPTTTTTTSISSTPRARIVAVSSGATVHPPGAGGTSGGVIVTLAIVAGLAAVGGALAWRRRRPA